ncbi:uncharacterized protein J4E88_004567 [Alternaria novae-zelandiae]|uniref:uncharacterized protein n=1 Tax=Alternaria novae-zelandiae TaxID=430562 RepID=UPI0020C4ED02|nr:uncharacterized protein J4E88_004567 [Alternaria novae-zelandiae]KAI4683391.1 hypothetical protein J4E88_004567 [Alternaria novae-zelandiae]
MSAIRDCVFFKETPSLLEEATTPRAQVIATSFYLMREFTSQLDAPLTSLPDKDDLHDLLSTYALQLFKETTIPWLVIPAAPGRGRGEMREALVQVCLETLMLSKSKPKKEQGKTVTARIVTAKKEAKKIAAPEMEPQGRVDGVSNPRKRSCRRYEGFAYRGHGNATGTTSKRTRTGASAQPPCESSAKDVISLLSDSDDGSEPIKPTTRGGRANRASSSYLIRADNELNGADAGSDEEYSPGQSDKEASPHTDSEGGMSAFPHHEASVAAFKFAQSITKWPAMGHVPYIAGGISGEKKGLRVCNDKMFYSWYLLSPEGNRAPWNNETHSFRYDLTKSTFNGHGFLNYLRDAGVSARHLVAMTSYILAISVAQESELQTKKRTCSILQVVIV